MCASCWTTWHVQWWHTWHVQWLRRNDPELRGREKVGMSGQVAPRTPSDGVLGRAPVVPDNGISTHYRNDRPINPKGWCPAAAALSAPCGPACGIHSAIRGSQMAYVFKGRWKGNARPEIGGYSPALAFILISAAVILRDFRPWSSRALGDWNGASDTLYK